MSGVIEGGIALLIALAGAFVLFGQIRENAKRNEEDIQAIMDYISQDFFVKKEKEIFNYDTNKYDTKMVFIGTRFG